MNVELNDISKKALKECKDALLRNDLGKVYDYLLDKLENAFDYEIGSITMFFESKGIYLEDYLNYIPSFAFTGWSRQHFNRWTTNLNGSKDWVVVPPKIQKLDLCAFSFAHIQKLALPNVKEIDSFCFEDSDIVWLKLGSNVDIRDNAFYGMDKLRMIDVPDENTKIKINQSRYDLSIDYEVTINVVK